jgi:hypothetical protein
MKKILLIHLGANGDCVMATTIARQIKVDYPGCRLTWCIGNRYASVILNNPDVDAIWEFELKEGESVAPDAWYRCRTEADKRKEAGEFDLIFNTQVFPDNIRNFDGSTRSSTFRNYSHPITIPVIPVMRLLPEEIANVQAFASQHRIPSYRHVILMECSPGSGQSAFRLQVGLALAHRLADAKSDLAVIVSTRLPFLPPHERVISGSTISFRENAALTHHCTFLVGCSSGVTWLATSDASKPLNTVQFISRNLGASFASVAYDFKNWGLSTDHIIENTTTDIDYMLTIVVAALENFQAAKETYHQSLRPIFWSWLCCVDHRKGLRGIVKSYQTMVLFIKRNGISFRDIFDVVSLLRVIKVAYSIFFTRNCDHDSKKGLL